MRDASGTDVRSLLDVERERVELALRRALDTLLPLLSRGLRGPVEHGVLTGGKRLRPILCVSAFKACGGESSPRGNQRSDAHGPIYDLAVSLEMIHAYSLMHDDLPCMDDAALRRGQPTPHTVYGETATMVGASTLIPAAGLHAWRTAGALGLGNGRRRELVRILADAAGAGGMVGGQGLDLLGEGEALSREALDELHRRKTGALLTASLLMGAVAAGASFAARAALRRYGEEVGLAFQIADDVLDATANAKVLGKEPSDRELDKSTYVLLLGVEEARREAVRRVRGAVEALETAEIQSPALAVLASYIVEREH